MDNYEWWWPRAWVPPSQKNPSSKNFMPQHMREWLRREKSKLVAIRNEG